MSNTTLQVWNVRNRRKHSRQALAIISCYGIIPFCLEICSLGGQNWQDMEEPEKGKVENKEGELSAITYIFKC